VRNARREGEIGRPALSNLEYAGASLTFLEARKELLS
jgi:hypothetical protein